MQVVLATTLLKSQRRKPGHLRGVGLENLPWITATGGPLIRSEKKRESSGGGKDHVKGKRRQKNSNWGPREGDTRPTNRSR